VRLDLGHVHGWCRATEVDQYGHHLTALSSAERRQCDRFHFDRDRQDYANAHDLLRRSLSRYGTTPPELWQFEAARAAKPSLSPSSPGMQACAGLDFNLSHTQGLVACVVGRNATVGIDVERIDRLHDAMSLATRFFSPAEVAELRDCRREVDRARQFIALWTLKESFIKAIGRGVSQPLGSFSFSLREPGMIAFTPPPEFTAGRWHFAQYDVSPNAMLAIAVGIDGAPTVLVRSVDGGRMVEVAPSRTSQLHS
jgi:4'-phosphopantetheinyl transferase